MWDCHARNSLSQKDRVAVWRPSPFAAPSLRLRASAHRNDGEKEDRNDTPFSLLRGMGLLRFARNKLRNLGGGGG